MVGAMSRIQASKSRKYRPEPGEVLSFAAVKELNALPNPNPRYVLERLDELVYMQRLAFGDPEFNNLPVLRTLIMRSGDWHVSRIAVQNPNIKDQRLLRHVAASKEMDWYIRQAAVQKIDSRRMLRKLASDREEIRWIRDSAAERLKYMPRLYDRVKDETIRQYRRAMASARGWLAKPIRIRLPREEVHAKAPQNA